jgi:hypothetical protein
MTKTISEIKSFLDDLKIHYTEKEDESRSCISVTSQRKDGSPYTLYMVSNKDYDLSFYVFNLIESDKAHETQLLSAINKLNSTFKYVKFVLDNNYRVHIEYDLLHATDNKGACALEMIVCSDKIIDDVIEVLTRDLLNTNAEDL